MIDWLKRDKKNLVIFVLAIGLLAAVNALLSSKTTPAISYTKEEAARRQQIKDNIIKSFPDQFVADKNAREIFAAADSTTAGLKVSKIFVSTKPPTEIKNYYSATLKADGWIEEKLTVASAPAGTSIISFDKELSRVIVILSASQSGTQFSVDYYPRLAQFDDPLR